MSARLEAFQRSVLFSAVHESQCREAPDREHEPLGDRKIMPACKSPLAPGPPPPGPGPPPPGPPPPPPPPAGPAFGLRAAGACLCAAGAAERAAVTTAACAGGVQLQRWQLSGGALVLNGTGFCAKPNWAPGGVCVKGAPIWLGDTKCDEYGFAPPRGPGGTIELARGCESASAAMSLCLVRGGAGALHLGDCSDPAASGWTEITHVL